jgi:hypothetical protein
MVWPVGGLRNLQRAYTVFMYDGNFIGWNLPIFCGESFFDYEYLREFEAKIGTARKVV